MVAIQQEEGAAVVATGDDSKAVEGIKERLEFFFSDANIRQDAFIRKLLVSSDEKSVSIDALLRFNTIKKHSDKAEVLVKAAKELADSLVVDEEKMTISRVSPFTKDMMNGNIPKSLYLTNLPVTESKEYDVKVEDLRSLFEKYGKVVLVKLKFANAPRVKTEKNDYYGPSAGQKRRKIPIGAAMIEFQNQEDLEKAAAATLTTKGGETAEPTDKISLADTDLGVMLLSEYIESRKGKKKSSGDKKRSQPEADEEEKEIPKFTLDWKPNCVIKVRGLPEGCDREAMLSAIGKGLDISPNDVKDRKIYVDYSRGQKDGAIRFPEPSDSVGELAKKLKDGELKILDASIEDAAILEGDDEKKYWEEFIEFKTKQMIQRAEEKKNARGNKKHKSGR